MSHERCTRPDGNKGCIDCVAYGAVEEQERIIKLIKKLMHDDNDCDWGCENYGCGNGYYDNMIERIKGENK